MYDYKVRFYPPEEIVRRFKGAPCECKECCDPPEVVYSYSPAVHLTVHGFYCFDCAAELGLIEKASDRARRGPEEVSEELREDNDRAHYCEDTWWVVAEAG